MSFRSYFQINNTEDMCKEFLPRTFMESIYLELVISPLFNMPPLFKVPL